MATKNKRELFDAAEYAKKIDTMIVNLRTKTPGEAVGKVGKNEILTMRREALQQLVKDGYTVNQIAEAMKDDVFSILPKTITEIIAVKKAVKAVRSTATVRAKKAATTGNDSATVAVMNTERSKQPAAVAGAPAAGSKATFEIKPDTKDL